MKTLYQILLLSLCVILFNETRSQTLITEFSPACKKDYEQALNILEDYKKVASKPSLRFLDEAIAALKFFLGKGELPRNAIYTSIEENRVEELLYEKIPLNPKQIQSTTGKLETDPITGETYLVKKHQGTKKVIVNDCLTYAHLIPYRKALFEACLYLGKYYSGKKQFEKSNHYLQLSNDKFFYGRGCANGIYYQKSEIVKYQMLNLENMNLVDSAIKHILPYCFFPYNGDNRHLAEAFAAMLKRQHKNKEVKTMIANAYKTTTTKTDNDGTYYFIELYSTTIPIAFKFKLDDNNSNPIPPLLKNELYKRL